MRSRPPSFLRLAATLPAIAVAFAAAAVVTTSCGGSSSTSPAPDTGPALLEDAGACGVTTHTYSVETGTHVPIGSFIDYPTNPPYGGPHYPVWATWGAHQKALPPGYWVHNLEHGGVVFLYRCASRAACPDLAAKVEAVAAALPADPLCKAEGEPTNARVVVVPDPDLPEGVQVAAAAWGWTLVSRCLDPEPMRNFYLAHFGHTYEDICYQGLVGEDVPDPDAGLDGGMDAVDPDADTSSDVSDGG